MMELKLGSQISAPGGNVIGFLERQPIPPQNNTSAHFSLFGFYALPLPEVGEYHVEVFVNSLSVHLISLPVHLKPLTRTDGSS